MNALILHTRNRIVEISRRIVASGQRLVPKAPQPVIEDAIPFQDGVQEILELRLPKLLRPSTYFVLYLFIVMLLIAAIMRVDVVVVSAGRFVTDTPTIVLQPLETAIIRELNVASGDKVTKGQILAKLDPTFSQADVSSLSTQQQSLLAQERRLEAELNDKTFEMSMPPSTDDLLQMSLYTQRQAEKRSRLQVFDEEIMRLRSSIESVTKDIELARQQLSVAKDVESMRSALEKSQTGSRLQLLDSQSARMRVERDYHDSTNHLVELQHSLESKRAERLAYLDEWRRTLLDNLVNLRTASANAGGGLAKATLMRNLVVIAAPEDGVVQDVAKLSVGSVARAAEALITIVPSRTKLIAEIMITSSDIGYVKAGDSAAIKVDAFPYSKHGMLTGRLSSISEDTVVASSPAAGAGAGGGSQDSSASGKGGSAFYRGWVELLTTKLENLPKGGRLIPGMTISAEVKVGTRSILAYFISPVAGGLGVSFREP